LDERALPARPTAIDNAGYATLEDRMRLLTTFVSFYYLPLT
jgi:hypothetical protein